MCDSTRETAAAVPSQHVVAIIPARGGSKGVPRKNIRHLCGKPLVAYSIEVALASRTIGSVVVSSEDEEILGIAASYAGCQALRRPARLGSDKANLADVVAHVSACLQQEGHPPDVTVILLPTSPFRNPHLVDFLVDKALLGHKDVRTVKKILPHERYLFDTVQGMSQLSTAGLLPLFRPYGVLTAHSAAPILPPYYHVIDDEIMLVDIDHEHEFLMAEALIRAGRFDFRRM